jgi:hypothetical protein
MEITYFEPQENRLIPARILEIRRTRAAIQELPGGKRWTVPLYMINIEGTHTDITPKKNHVDRLSLKIGDQVGFTGKNGSELFGAIIKLNPKRAKIQTREGIWAVPYSMLFTIIDGEQARDHLHQLRSNYLRTAASTRRLMTIVLPAEYLRCSKIQTMRMLINETRNRQKDTQIHRHRIPKHLVTVAHPILGGLHHEYGLMPTAD